MYAAIAWVLLQVGSAVFTPLGLPGWSQIALIVVLGLGFPVALVFAWIYDVTPDGIVKSVNISSPTTSRGRRIDFVIIALLVVALAMAVFLWRHDARTAPTSPINANASVAVLPFVAMSDDPSLRHLGDGIAEEVTNQLVGRPGLEIASRSSAFQAREGKDAVATARALGVSYVVEGSVRPVGDQIRLTASLFACRTHSLDLANNRVMPQYSSTSIRYSVRRSGSGAAKPAFRSGTD